MIIGQNCIIMSQNIRDLARKLDISDELTKHAVGVWQTENNSVEIPSPEEISPIIYKIEKELSQVDYKTQSKRMKYRRAFSPQLLDKRINHIARQFSVQVEIAHYDTKIQLQKDIDELNLRLLKEKLSKTLTKKLKKELNNKYRTLTKISDPEKGRQRFLNLVKISDIMDRVKESYSLTEEELVDYYGEDKGKYMHHQYQLILEYFDELFSDATYLIEDMENIRIITGGKVVKAATDEIEDSLEDDETSEDARGNEGWGMQAKFTNPRLTALAVVKRTLGNIQKLDSNGEYVEDDLGELEYMNPNTTYHTLLHELSKRLLSADDFSVQNEDGSYSFPALEDLIPVYPWVEQVIMAIENSPELISAFYSSFRQTSTEIWTNVEGRPTSENTDLASRSTLRDAIQNYELGNILSENTGVYTSTGKINVSKAKEIYDLYKETKLSYEDVYNLLRGLGFDVPQYVIEGIYYYDGTNEEIKDKKETSFENFQQYLLRVYADISKLKENDNLIESMATHYRKIAQEIGTINDFSTLVSIRVGNKSLQAYSYPNAIDGLIGNLKREDKALKYIEDNFLRYYWFNSNGEIKAPWVEKLYTDNTYREALKVIDSPLSKVRGEERTYTDYNDAQLRTVMISQYFAGGSNRVYYNFPLFSDSPVMKFLCWKEENRLGTYTNAEKVKETAINNLTTVVIQEIERMNLISKRAKSNAIKITSFDERGKSFCFIPDLNFYRSSKYGNKTLLEVLNSSDAQERLGKLDKDIIKDYLAEVLEADFNVNYKFNDKGYASDKKLNKVFTSIKSDNPKLKKFTHKDLAIEYYYNNVFAQSQIIELTVTDLAFYKDMDDFQKRYKEVYASGRRLNTNSKYGRKIERAIYLSDENIQAPSYDTIKSSIINTLGEDSSESKYLLSLLERYKNICATDGQSYRSLNSYRAVLDMLGQWTPEQQIAWDNLSKGVYDMGSILTIWQAIKPFVYTQLPTPSGVEGITLKVPHQHKNSEFALLMFAHNLFSRSERLKQLESFMTNNNIDVIHFQSAVKHGASNVLDISGVSDENIEERLVEELKKHEYDPQNTTIYDVPYEDYMIAQNTPEHYFDSDASFGSQLRTLLVSDLPDTFEVTYNGRKYTKVQLRDHYDSLIIENLLESAEKVIKDLGTIEKVQELLLSQVEGNPKYGRDIIEALQLVDRVLPNGRKVREFNTPLWEPSITEQLQEIFLSTFKNRITKQKINGGKATAVSSFGFSNDLKVEKDSNGNIVGIQCYLPAWSRKFFYKYLDEATGEVDIEAIKKDAPELLKIIGYRIPTENKYSMFPLIVKGFMPLQSGGSIMLPVEAITMSGMDFDIDSVYLMFKSFDTAEDGTAISIKYDSNKSYAENSKEARDNEIIDIAHAILTNSPDKLFNSNNFDTIEKMANIFRVIDNSEMLEKSLGEPLSTSNYEKLRNRFLSVDGNKIKKFVKNNKRELFPLSPETFIHYHQMNMVGGALIGMYANSSTSQAKLQTTSLSLHPKLAINLNGKVYQNLTNIYNPDGDLISLIGAEFSAASVDNGKNPVLADLLQNTKTAKLTSVLIRLGFPIEDIALFFKMPTLESINVEELAKYPKAKGLYDQITSTPNYGIDGIKFSSKNWMDAILLNKLTYKELADNGLLASYISTIVYTDKLRKMYEEQVVPQVSLITSTGRADSPNGAVGHNAGLAMVQLLKVDKLHNLERSKTINGISSLISNILSESFNRDRLREEFKNSSMPVVQAFHTLGIELAVQEASKWFLVGKDTIQQGIINLGSISANGYSSESTIRSYLFGIHEYFRKKNNTFGNTESITMIEKQNYYLNNFPKKFLEIKSKYPEINAIPVINRMTVMDGKIVLPDSSHISKNVREYLSLGFEELLYSDFNDSETNFVAIQLALDLYRYSFYKDSFLFGPNNFGYMFSSNFKNAMLDDINTEKELPQLVNDFSEMNNYLTQFIARKYRTLGLYRPHDKHVKRLDGSEEKVSNQNIIVDIRRRYTEPPLYITYNGMLYEYSGEMSEEENKPIYTHLLEKPIIAYDPNIKSSIEGLESYSHINSKSVESIDAIITPSGSYEDPNGGKVDEGYWNSLKSDNSGAFPVAIGTTLEDDIFSTEESFRFDLPSLDEAMDNIESTLDAFLENNPIDEMVDKLVCKE